MTLYRFEAFAPSGQAIDGVIEAELLARRLVSLAPKRCQPVSGRSHNLAVQALQRPASCHRGAAWGWSGGRE